MSDKCIDDRYQCKTNKTKTMMLHFLNNEPFTDLDTEDAK